MHWYTISKLMMIMEDYESKSDISPILTKNSVDRKKRELLSQWVISLDRFFLHYIFTHLPWDNNVCTRLLHEVFNDVALLSDDSTTEAVRTDHFQRGLSTNRERKISIIIHTHHKHAFSHPIKYIAFCKLIPTHRLHVTVYTEKFHYFKKTSGDLFP